MDHGINEYVMIDNNNDYCCSKPHFFSFSAFCHSNGFMAKMGASQFFQAIFFLCGLKYQGIHEIVEQI